MKRLSTHRCSTDWSLCCVCQGLVHTASLKVEKLAEQFLAFWENGLLPFDASLISDGQVDGKPNFKECMLRNKQYIIMTVTQIFLITNLTKS